jgi:glycosyltransferase involved in cell wall biosynthesis
MKVLVVSNMYPPHYYGGYELSCRDVVEHWRERGHRVTVLTTNMRVAGVIDLPGERDRGIHRDLDFYWEDHALVSPSPWRRLEMERTNQRHLRKALDDVTPDVVSVWNMGAMSLGLVTTIVEARLPLVLVVCDDWLDYGPALDAWTRLFARRPRTRLLVRRLTGLPTGLPADLGDRATGCFVSEATRSHASARTGLRFTQSTVVYSGIDPADFPLGVPEVREARPWGWRLLSVGRIDPRKGVDTIIRALPLLPEQATLSVLGRGDSRHLGELHGLVDELGLADRVRFDVVQRDELRRHYEEADALVFPPTWSEPFGLIPIEAMACGTPVVATGTGGSAEFLSDCRNSLVFPPGDAVQLAAALRRLADDPALRARLVRGGLATASELTVDRLAEVLEAWHLAAADRFRYGPPPDRPPPTLTRTSS